MEYGNNVYGGYQQPMGMNYGWNANPGQQVKQMNVLTADEIQQLMKTENKFTLALTQTEKLKAACNHRRADGLGDALVENADGTITCSICGYTFKPLDPKTSNEEFLGAAVTDIVDIIQTIKMIWIDADPQVIREYSQVIPLIEKLPKLFEIAVKDYSNHEQYNGWRVNTNNMNTVQLFNMLSGLMSGAGQQPQTYQQPMQPQPAPSVGQMMGGPVPMGGNPFGYYGQPQAGYQPQMNGFIYNPNMQQQPVQTPVVDPVPGQAAPAETTTTTDGATTTTSASFKA